MIKVAFWYDRPQEYSGGLNYFRNLLYALSSLDSRDIYPYVFFGTDVDEKTIAEFRQIASVVTTRVLSKGSLAWVAQRLLFKYFGSLFLVKQVVKRCGIDIVSHGVHVYARSRPFPVVVWIPDFQYWHLPELFPARYVARQNEVIQLMARHSDAIILSSNAALEDFRQITGHMVTAPVTVLPFVSQPTIAKIERVPVGGQSSVGERYGLAEAHYFHLPNQFWRHKNHIVVFEAVRLAREMGTEIRVVCTGNLKDYRSGDEAYADQVRGFISANQLESNISVLGSIDYGDVLQLMQDCIAVINPSRFEGWSSTVEEAKSMGKRLILSDIPVHREQAPARATYFQPDGASELAQVMVEYWHNPVDPDVDEERRRAQVRLEERTREFARGYTEVIVGLYARSRR